MIRPNEKESLKEFKSFIESNAIPSTSVSQTILAQVRKNLNPPAARVFGKLGAIQLLVGAVTLVFCPQLGVGPLIGGHGIMALFMFFGPVVCAGFCGAFYLSTSIFLASFALRPEELRSIRKRQLVGIPAISAATLMALMLLGGSGTFLVYAVWLLGAIIGGKVSSHIAISVRVGKIAA